jgi:hypothetical protein
MCAALHTASATRAAVPAGCRRVESRPEQTKIVSLLEDGGTHEVRVVLGAPPAAEALCGG